jgi:hypothetical protein
MLTKMRDATTQLAIATCIFAIILYSVSVYFFSLKLSPLYIVTSSPLSSKPASFNLPSAQDDNSDMAVNLSWSPPNATWISNLTDIINGTGTFGFVFSADGPPNGQYGEYSWCNMPHVRTQEYPRVGKEFELIYVEVVCFCLFLVFQYISDIGDSHYLTVVRVKQDRPNKSRSTATTSAHRTQQTHFHTRRRIGPVPTQPSSIMLLPSAPQRTSPRIPTGR